MRLIISLAGLIGLGLAVAWFGYGLPPKAVYYKTLNMLKGATTSVQSGASDVGNAGSRFSEVIQNRYNSQDMTEPSKY